MGTASSDERIATSSSAETATGTAIGAIAEIWRYPVKSMAGERLGSASMGTLGIPGDRAWAVRDEVRGGIRGAKKIAPLMQCAARYPGGGTTADVEREAPEITLPDGTVLRANDPAAAAAVSKAVSATVTLWPRRPAEDLEHYRRGMPDHEDLETELRSMFGREANEPLPDFSLLPAELFEYESPPGTYFDAFPLLLLTTSSLRRLQQLAPDSRIDLRRFRPNLLVDTKGDDFIEAAWLGRRLAIGDAVIEVTVSCPRCVMITLPTGDLPRDPRVLRAVVQNAEQNIGVYARVEKGGTVREGDELRML